jgi:hypothetical protein
MKTSDKTRKINGLILPFLMLVGVLTSCTETIEFTFDTAEPQIVVEAFVPESQYAEVVLSKTVNFNTAKNDNKVSNALVVLEDGSGLCETLYEVAPGRYRSKEIKGVPGSSYKLTVLTDNNITVIKSEDRMPKPVFMHTLRVRESILPDVDCLIMPEWEVIVEYTDPEDETNYYRFVEYINGKAIGSYVENDKFNNGKKNKSFLTSVDRNLKSGDTLTVEMQSISKAVYDYFFGFSAVNSIVQGSNNTNPISNISGANLGYFSAHTVHRRSVVIE